MFETMKNQSVSQAERSALLIEIGSCNQAIKAFEAGMPWLAPEGLNEAPSVEWIRRQRKLCVARRQELAA